MQKDVNPGIVIKTLLGDISAWKEEDILPDEHIEMLKEAENHLWEADKHHKRFLTSKATMDAKQRRGGAQQAMVTRYRRECEGHAYHRDNSISLAEEILAKIIAQIEQLADE